MQAKWASELLPDGLPPKPRRTATAGSHYATWCDLFLTTTQLSAKASGLSGVLALRRSSVEAYVAKEFEPSTSRTTSVAVGLGVPIFRRSAAEQERPSTRAQSPTVPFRRSNSLPRTSKPSSTARLTAVQSNTTPRVVHASKAASLGHASKAPSLVQASEASNPLSATLPPAPPPPAADAVPPCVHTAVEVDPSLSTPLSSALIWRNSLRI